MNDLYSHDAIMPYPTNIDSYEDMPAEPYPAEQPPVEEFPPEPYPLVPFENPYDITYPVSGKAKYLSDILIDLDDNCILDKGGLGTGGTTLALSNHVNYIIAIPYKSIAESKLSNDYGHEILFVKSGVYEDEIKEYMERNIGFVKKIFVTYDALYRLSNVIDPQDFKLLVDEAHVLLLSYEFRNKAIRGVLDNFRKFKSTVFMSGTPILNKDFALYELQKGRTVTYKWVNPRRVDLKLFNCIYSVEASLTNFILNHLRQSQKDNLYIFVNSIEFVSKVIDHPHLIDVLNDSNCKFVHGEDKSHKTRLERSQITDLGSTKVNFITSTAFEGADIIDEFGKIIIAIDANIEHMKMDTSTTLYQVCGRIRNVQSSSVDLYCKFINKEFVDYATYKVQIEQNLKNMERLINEINRLPLEQRKLIDSKSFLDPQFVSMVDGKFTVDRNYLPVKLWRYSMSDQIYANMDAFSKSILNSSYFNLYPITILEDKNDFEFRRHYSSSLKNVICQLKKLLSIEDKYESSIGYGTASLPKLSLEDKRFLDDATKKFPYIWDALKYIGIKKMQQMNFNTRNIKSRVIQYVPLNQTTKIITSLHEMRVQGNTYSRSDIKKKLTSIYKKLDIKTIAKATDIEKYFICEEITKTINGKRTKCFALLEPKLLVLD